jgi:predicted metalloprotease with PDZ domain
VDRPKTDGAKSLDDFCEWFFAAVPGKQSVAGYDLADVVRDLSATAEYDWQAFLRRRVEAPQEAIPLDVIGRLGYRLKYSDKPAGSDLKEAVPPPDNPAADSLGLVLVAGEVAVVDPGLPADRAGLARSCQPICSASRAYATTDRPPPA